MLATPAVMPAASVGETADMAGLAARSTAGDSSCTGTVFENGTTDLSRTPRFRRNLPRRARPRLSSQGGLRVEQPLGLLLQKHPQTIDADGGSDGNVDQVQGG